MEKYFLFKYHSGIILGVAVFLWAMFYVYMICVVEPIRNKHIVVKVSAGVLYWAAVVSASIGTACLLW